jgi:uracil-DNA glycosylase family 4
MGSLTEIHAAIDGCTACASFAVGFKKPLPLVRGDKSKLVLVGQDPGSTELTSGKAFSGQSGSRLDEWLVKCGFDKEAPRSHAYLTATLKCPAPHPKHRRRMLTRCRHFLDAQLAAICPTLVITLGAVAYAEMAVNEMPFSAAICTFFDSTAERLLVGRRPFPYRLLPWPHPSGRNRWLNDSSNCALLESTFDQVRLTLEG